MYVNLQQLKKHLNIDSSFHEDDEYLVDLVNASELAIERYIDDKFENILIASGRTTLPPTLQQAVLILTANFYANRESIAFSSHTELPYSLTYLLDLYKNYSKKYTGGKDKVQQ
ncbi:MAG: phage gp6-like head-tail connector protein [Peptostreptococcus sp.]|nr:phage gp6-like head-tail connector protein [Peptostreptococcus sp.]